MKGEGSSQLKIRILMDENVKTLHIYVGGMSDGDGCPTKDDLTELLTGKPQEADTWTP